MDTLLNLLRATGPGSIDLPQLPAIVIVGAIALAVCYSVMKALIHIQREHIKELSIERDDYRAKLHTTRDVCQALELKNNELLGRPNLLDLGKIIDQNSSILASLIDKLTARDAMFDKIEKAFQETMGALRKLSSLIESRTNGKPH